jgi:hypothetical protein
MRLKLIYLDYEYRNRKNCFSLVCIDFNFNSQYLFWTASKIDFKDLKGFESEIYVLNLNGITLTVL